MLSLFFYAYLSLWVAQAQNDCDDSRLCEGDLLDWSFETVGTIDCDTVLSPEEAALEPSIAWGGGKEDIRYMLLGIDPDAPSCEDPSRKWVRHWLIGDLTAADLADGDLSRATNISEYRGPNPPAGSGLHRYQFMIYNQSVPMEDMVGLPYDAPVASWNASGFLQANGWEDDDYLASFQYKAFRDEQ